MRASPLDIAIRKKPSIRDGVNLFGDPLFYKAIGFQRVGKLLRQGMVFRARGSPEPVIRQRKPFACIALNQVLLIAVSLNRFSLGLRGEFSGRAVLICGANIQDIMATQALEASKHIGR